VTGHQRTFTPPRHLIPPLICQGGVLNLHTVCERTVMSKLHGDLKFFSWSFWSENGDFLSTFVMVTRLMTVLIISPFIWP
jgi:hypothetical protein